MSEREATLKFSDRRSRMRQVTVGRTQKVTNVTVSSPIKVYVGRKALEVK